MSSKKNPPLPAQSSPQRWRYAWETSKSKLFRKAINTREQSASMYFTKWPLSKVTNCPDNILAATAGGLIIRKHSLDAGFSFKALPLPLHHCQDSRTVHAGRRGFSFCTPLPPPWTTQGDKKCTATAVPPDFEQDTHLFSSPHSKMWTDAAVWWKVTRHLLSPTGCQHKTAAVLGLSSRDEVRSHK